VGLRGELAREAECFLSCCGCDVDQLRCQVKLDKVLFDVDRAIDLFAQGQGRPPEWGTEEKRASIYGIVARNMSNERGCISPEVAYSLIAEVARAGQVLISSARTLIEGKSPVNGPQRNFAREFEPWIRLFIASADMLVAGRSVSEAILRDIESLTKPTAIAGNLATSRQVARLNRLADEIADSPVPSAAEALQLIIDTAELVAGDSNMGDVAGGVVPTANETGGQYIGTGIGTTLAALVTLNASSPLNDAKAAILSAQAALVASLVAIGNPTPSNLEDAGVKSADARQKAEKAHATAFPIGIDPPPALEQRSLAEAENGARAAGDVSESAAGLPVGKEGEPPALSRALDAIAFALAGAGSPLPTDAAERAALMREVFEDQIRGEQDWLDLIASLAPRCLNGGRRDLVLAARELLYGNPNYTGTRELPAIPVNTPTVPLRTAVSKVGDVIGREIGAAAITLKEAIEGWSYRSGGGGGPSRSRSRGGRGGRAIPLRVSPDPVKASAPVTPGYTGAEPTPELHEFMRVLYSVSKEGSRKEIASAINDDRLRPEDWEYLKAQYGASLKEDFIELVDNLVDVSRTEDVDKAEARKVLQRPFDLGE
jgi:hypothetical protein